VKGSDPLVAFLNVKSVPRFAAENPRDFMKNGIFKISKKNYRVKKNRKKYKS